ncbi:MAG: fibronectin type III domain-containing protein [Verrucomicrobia bacterium]|nr:fibronectin type III domain-containing protein [Verrucomicrobiota bacterium]
MAEVALKLDDRIPDEIRTLAIEVKAGLTNNSHFPNGAARAAGLGASVAVYDTAVNDLAAKQSLVNLARVAVETALEGIKTELRGAKTDCESVANGNRAMLESAGLPIKAPKQSVGKLPKPASFVVTRGDHEGHADGQCHKVDGARSYKGEHSVSQDGPWTLGYEGTKSSFTIPGLTPGTMYYFRMAAFGTNGWGPWSDITQCRIA